ncbi:MAG: hypothetical protein J6M66_06305 [Lachnospiraceae bacterium]|nr:hypothetical protein [Lachnospiraceae bacterium]
MKWNGIKQHGKTIGAAVLVMLLICLASWNGESAVSIAYAVRTAVFSDVMPSILIVIIAAAALAVDGMRK